MEILAGGFEVTDSGIPLTQIPTTGEAVALTDPFVKNIKPPEAAIGAKHSDGLGLYLHLKEADKYWRMNYRFIGKRKTLALGVYPGGIAA